MASKQVFFGWRCCAVAGAIVLLAACGGSGGLGSTYTVGGTVSGLAGDSLVLQNNAGDDLTLSADGTFTFARALGAGSPYVVSVRTQPQWQVCAVAKGSGSALDKPVSDVTVTCTTQAQVSMVAGSGFAGAVDGNGVAASFDRPRSLAFDHDGSLLLTDTGNSAVRRISPSGDVTTFANRRALPVGAFPSELAGLAVNSAGNTYLADDGTRLIFQITPTGVVSTFAGGGSLNPRDGLGTQAAFQSPTGVAINSAGEIYIMERRALRKITPVGLVSTLAGSQALGFADGQGSAAVFDQAAGIALDKAGNIYVADSSNNRIRKVTPEGLVSTLAGSGAVGATDGLGTQASFSSPQDVAVDGDGNVYVADTSNHLVRRITPAGVVSTLAGQPGVIGSQNGASAAATFNFPYGIAVGPDGAVFVADTRNHLIRKLTPVSAP